VVGSDGKAQVAVQAEHIGVETGAHAVQFYERDEELTATVARYLADALGCGGAAVAIATESHRQSFEAELEAGGVDVTRLGREGRLVMLDAHEIAATLVTGGRVDREAFVRIIGSTMRAAAAADRPVRAYGEIVAVLWDAGDVLAAIELEKLWNELGQELPFALLCGYPSTSVSGPEHADALGEVCHLHSAVLNPPARGRPPVELSAEFRPDFDAPAAAREIVAAALRLSGHDDDLLADAQLVVSELATNAVIHANSPFSVSVRCEGSAVHVRVRDESPRLPVVREPGPAALFGRGMRLIATVSSVWGVEPTDGGKVVWADLRR
jgi:anti-sigma regulatory factor (Ser/Thr protein kinase)